MKLLRMTTHENDAYFETKLNTDLIVEPYSQIALSNASFTNDFKTITLSGVNDTTIQFNVGSGNHIANLTLDTYAATATDGVRLFQDIEVQLNKQLTLVGKEFGGRFIVAADKGKNQIAYVVSPYEFNTTRTTAIGVNISGVEGAPGRIVTLTEDTAPSVDDSARLFFNDPLVNGAGVFRTQIAYLLSNANVDNGYRMVLTETPPAQLPADFLTAEEEKYMIGIVSDETDNTLLKYVYRDGTGLTKNLLDGATKIRPNDAENHVSTNDSMDLQISGGNVKGIVYKSGAPPIEAFSVSYNNNDLYGLIIVKGIGIGDDVSTGIYEPRYTRQTTVAAPTLKGNQIYPLSLSVPVPPANRTSNMTLNLSGCIPVADFLGYDAGTTNYIYLVQNYTNVATFTSELGLTLGSSDSYLIQFLTIPLDSYDGYIQGQYSILKVIPNMSQAADQRKVNYEANNLTFIDLKNQFPITLRNIKARILTDELEPISTLHMSSITVLIKPKAELI